VCSAFGPPKLALVPKWEYSWQSLPKRFAMATMNISLPDDLKGFIDDQVVEHGYGSTSEYLRDLIRKQRDVENLRQMLLDGANSGPGKLIDDAFFAELREQAGIRTAG